EGHWSAIPLQRSSKALSGTEISSTSSVIAIANTPSLNASSRLVSKRSSMSLFSARPGRFLQAVSLARLQDHDLALPPALPGRARLHVRLERLGVGLDEREG